MPPKAKEGDLVNKVGAGVLLYLIERCKTYGFWGRCYSKRKDHQSPIPGSNHVFYVEGDELVVLSQQNMDGDLRITTFVRTDQPGPLTTEIHEVLIRNGHDIVDG